MPISKEKKVDVVNQLTDLFKNAKSVVFADYKGVSVQDFATLRGKLREKDVVYKVAKKTLIKLAAEQAGFKDIPEEVFEGQVGAAFSQGDEVAAAKTLFEFSKDNENIKLLGALMEGRTLSKEETLQLAKIPGKEELLAKLVGSMQAPISGFHGTLHALMRNLVGVISAYKDKVEKDAPAEKAEVKEEAPAEEKAEAETPKAEEKPAEEVKEEAAPAEETPKAEEEKVEETSTEK